ncbi:hypothetical protein JD844_002074 [Phrynosoma platyrhinos]|uniref:Uncharacterized protein n=1 Tax=Phrynosoma platyrhinos TaxID=52577 RepID=A0ABQ7TBG5_PHRPL|nr:hypothetical protein JD844_002074 [Phrynosoma platyrhinos]
MEVVNMMEQPIKVTEWQQTYTYDSGIHSGLNTQVPSVSSKCLVDDDDLYGKQYTIKKTTTYSQSGAGQVQAQAQAQAQGDIKLHVKGAGDGKNHPMLAELKEKYKRNSRDFGVVQRIG